MTASNSPAISNGAIIPDATGDYASDCIDGRNHADAIIKTIQGTANPSGLFFHVEAMMKETETSANKGFVVGFFHRLAQLASGAPRSR